MVHALKCYENAMMILIDIRNDVSKWYHVSEFGIRPRKECFDRKLDTYYI